MLIKNRISINEILTEMRIQGIGSISDVYYGILEQNGKLSLITKDASSPVSHSIVIDGAIEESTIRRLGYDECWLSRVLEREELKAEEIFLLSVNDRGNINIIKKETTNK